MKISAAVSIGAAAALAGAYAFVVRPWFLTWGSTPEERQKSWPGDAFAPGSRVTSMRAITIDAKPEEVWPWILQIGQDRAGFYSYRRLENAAGARMPRVEYLVEQFQHRYVGDTVWLSDPRTYGGRGKLVVGYLEENRAMILITPEDWEQVLLGRSIRGGTWGFILEPAPDGKTRLLMRSVSNVPPVSRQALLGYSWELAHFIMERQMMVHVKELVEQLSAPKISLEEVSVRLEKEARP